MTPAYKSVLSPLDRAIDKILWTEEREWLDIEGYKDEHHARQEIDKANRWFLIYHCILHELAPILTTLYERSRRPVRVIEMGPGYGGLLLRLDAWSKKQGVPLELAGFDIDPVFLEQARRHTKDISVTLFHGNALDLSMIKDGSYDLYISTFTLHHFLWEGVITLLKEAHRISPSALYFRDFHRCLYGWPILSLALRVFLFSETMRHDGVISLRRSYRPQELAYLAKAAGLPSEYVVKKHFPFYHSLSGISR